MTTRNEFLSKLIIYLQKYYPQNILLTVEASDFKYRKGTFIEDLTEEFFDDSFNDFNDSVAISTVTPRKYLARMLGILQRKQENEILPKKYLETDLGTLSDKELLKLTGRTKSLKGIKLGDSPLDSFMFLDIDLKDSYLQLVKDGFLPEKVDSESDAKEHLKHISQEKRKEMASHYIDFKAMDKEVKPNLVTFTGNGVHLWFSMHKVKLKDGEYPYLHDQLVDMLEDMDLIGSLKFDRANGIAGRNLRLPFTVNRKNTPPAKVEILSSRSWESTSPVLSDAKERTQMPDTVDSSRIDSSVEPGDFFDQLRNNSPESKRTGMLQLFSDWRLKYDINDQVTFKGIIGYLGLVNTPVKDGDGEWQITNSPLREDKNPSFAYNDHSKMYRDFARDESEEIGGGDYGDLMRLCLDVVKEDMKLYSILPTTSDEAQWHILNLLYQQLLISKGFKESTKFTFMLPKKDDTGKAVKAKIAGLDYYKNMLYSFDSIRVSALSRVPRNSSDRTEYTKALLLASPQAYYFYKYNDNSTALEHSLPTLYKYALKWLFQKFKMMVNVTPHKFELYVEENGFHILYDFAFPYLAVSGEGRNIHLGAVESALLSMNVLNLHTITRADAAKKVYSMFHSLAKLPETLANSLTDNPDVHSLEGVKRVIVSKIDEQFSLGDFYNFDFPLKLCTGDKYIQFQNCFVKYDSKEISEIGEIIPRAPGTKYDLMMESVVDISLPFVYQAEGKTPLWDGFVEFLTYGGNKMDKILAYFLGSILIPPNGSDTRSIFLHGSGSNGKSTLSDILAALFTKRYASQKEIVNICTEKDSGNQARMELIGKLINISPDGKGEALDANFKNIVTGDVVQTRELYKAAREVRLTTHLISNVNSLPSIKGESFAYSRRILLGRLYNTVSGIKKDPRLAEKIIESEGGILWGKIIAWSKKYRKDSIYGFLTLEEVAELEERLLENNDLYEFIMGFTQYDIPSLTNEGSPSFNKVRLTKTMFKRIYNEFRKKQDLRAISSDKIAYEAETFIKEKLSQSADYLKALGPNAQGSVNMGFGHKDSKGFLGFKGVYLLIPRSESGALSDMDSRNN